MRRVIGLLIKSARLAQKFFCEKVKSLSAMMQEINNPFKKSADLLVLDAKNVAEQTLIEMVATHRRLGKGQFQLFMQGLEDENENPLYPRIKINLVSLFKQEQAQGISKKNVLKDDCQLFPRLFISCQNRQCDLQESFKHENLMLIALFARFL